MCGRCAVPGNKTGPLAAFAGPFSLMISLLMIALLTGTGCQKKLCMTGTDVTCPCPEVGPGGGQQRSVELCSDENEPNPCQNYTRLVRACSFAQSPLTFNSSSSLLQYTTIDGMVDSGTSELTVQIPADDDAFETKLEGRVAIVGGGCYPGQQCNIQLALAQLAPPAPVLYTHKSRKISEVAVGNLQTWNGLKRADDSIEFEPASELVIAARTEAQPRLAVFKPAANIQGRMYWKTTRLKGSGLGGADNNLLRIWGDFANGYARAHLEISIWTTDCRPVITPTPACGATIDPFTPATLSLGADAKLLGNLQASLDLCEATLAADPAQVCTAGKIDEFPTFHCITPPLPPPDSPEYDKLLTFRWEDAAGVVLGETRNVTLESLPLFPVRLTVTNKWGRTVTSSIASPPPCASKVPPAGLPTFGVLSGDGRKRSGSANWASRFDPEYQRYEIAISGEDYYYQDHTTVLTPSFGSSQSGACSSGSVGGKMLIECRDGNGTPITPASIAFVSFRKPGATAIVKGPLAYGVVSQNGSKLSGSSNWSSAFDTANQQFKITISGVNYHHHDFATLVTPAFHNGESGVCTSDSVDGKLLVRCKDAGGKSVMPVLVSFVSFQTGGISVAKGPTAFGVISGSGQMTSGSANWSSSFNSSDKTYQVSITGENYHFQDYATVVAPSSRTGERGFCTSNSVNGRLVIQCYDHSGNPTEPPSVAFLSYRKP